MPIEVDSICPDVLAGKKMNEIKDLPAYEGKVVHKLSDVFDISGKVSETPADIKIVVQKSTMKLRRIGERISAGEIEVHGDVGTHIGDSMSGGKIIVHGNADHYAGCQMTGGELQIKGNAGDYLGSAFRGEWRGMKGGKIIVDGDAGFEIAAWMRGTKKTRAKGEPFIHVKGNCGLHAGHHNHGGFLVIGGNCVGCAGSDMARGDVIIIGKTDILASFIDSGEEAAEVESIGVKGPFTVYKGDQGIGGKGRLYIKK